MNYLELCQKVREEAGVSGRGPTSVTDQAGILGRIVSWVNQSDLEIQNEPDRWSFLWSHVSSSFVSGKQSYLPADLGMNSIANHRNFESVIVGGEQIEIIPWQAFYQYTHGTQPLQAHGVDYLSVDPARNVQVYPTPSQAVSVNITYYRQPVPMASNTDVSPIPVEHHWVIVWKAIMHYAINEEDNALWQKASIEYARCFKNLARDCLPQFQFEGSAF